MAQKARVRIPIGPFFRPWSILKVGKTYLFFFFLYVRNTLPHAVNVSTGFPLFQLPKVVSSILPFLHPFSIFGTAHAFWFAPAPYAGGPFLSHIYKFTLYYRTITTQMSFRYAPTTSDCRTSPTTSDCRTSPTNSDHFRWLPISEPLFPNGTNQRAPKQYTSFAWQ